MRIHEVIDSIQNWLSRPPVDPHKAEQEEQRDCAVRDAFDRLAYERRVMRQLGEHLQGRRDDHEPPI